VNYRGRRYEYTYDEIRVKCRGNVVWHIRGAGFFCNSCYTKYFNSNDVDPGDVTRLSDREEDFKSPPAYKG
jgi:hypothetical protein